MFGIPYTDMLSDMVYRAISFSVPDGVFLVLTIVLLASLAGAAILIHHRCRVAGAPQPQRIDIRVFGVFALTYICCLIGVLSVVFSSGRIGNRTLYPSCYPIIFVVVLVFDWLFRNDGRKLLSLRLDSASKNHDVTRKRRKHVFIGGVAALLVIWVACSAVLHAGRFYYQRNSGWEKLRADRSPTIRYVQQAVPAGALVSSNDRDSIVWHTDHLGSVILLPQALRPALDGYVDAYGMRVPGVRSYAGGPAYVAWFFDGGAGLPRLDPDREYDDATLSAVAGVEEVARLSDGVVFLVSASSLDAPALPARAHENDGVLADGGRGRDLASWLHSDG